MAPRKLAANSLIAAFIMNRVYPDALAVRGIVVQLEHTHLPYQARAEELADGALVPVILPDIAQHRHSAPDPAISGNQ